ncbi:MAG TPA: histidinol phosphatase [Clostridia bacterium]|nr:histidinol phosphatase [Clostridia bacterium]
MKIDLHCHTKKVKHGEPATRNVSVELFQEKVEEADIGILAITNHNSFDYDQFCIFREAVKGTCQVLPGIELDINGQSGVGHLIVISNPEKVSNFINATDSLLSSKSPDSFSTSIQEVVRSYETCDVLFVPHSFKKESSLDEADINELKELVDEKHRVILETTYRSLGVYTNFGYSVIAGSDVRDWSVYEQAQLPDLRLPVKTFSQLLLLAQKNAQLVDTLLSKKRKTIISASPYKGVNIPLPIYQDINILFGQKGTGKTKILKSIEQYYKSQSVSCSSYYGSERDESYKEFEDTSAISASADTFGIDDCSEEFLNLKSWKDTVPCLFREYSDHCETEGLNKAKKRLLITQTTLLSKLSIDTTIANDYKNVSSSVKAIKDFLNRQPALGTADLDLFFTLLQKVEESAYKAYLENWRSSEAVKLTNHLIRGIRKQADRCTNTKSRPNGTGFEDFVSSRIALYQAANKIASSLSVPESTSNTEFFGSIEGKGNLYLRTKHRFICSESYPREFPNKKTRLQEAAKLISEIKKCFLNKEIGEKLLSFNEICTDYSIHDLSPFIGVRIETTFEDGTPYSPSSGEKGILLLQHHLGLPSDIYILDEPEIGMGNSFIKSSVIPEIMKLAESGKTVIIATHNANIAVLTLPYMSIFREHSDGNYRTYTGNPFSDRLINIDEANDEKSWTSESMHTLEGGKEAFYGRKSIYES